MSELIYINGQLIDYSGKPVSRKIQVSDIGDIGSSKSNFSYSIRIPRTKKNEALLDGLGVMGSISNKPYENIFVNYISEGVDLVINGRLLIRSLNDDYYSANIIDGVIDLQEKLGDKSILDLDFSDLVHNVTPDNIVNSFQNKDGFVYAVASMDDFNMSTSLRNFVFFDVNPPSVYLHTIIRKIINELGVQFFGNMFDSSFENGDFDNDNFFGDESYYSEVVIPSKGYELEENFSELNTINFNGNYQINIKEYTSNINSSLIGSELITSSVSSNSLFANTSVSGEYQVLKTGYYLIRINENLNSESPKGYFGIVTDIKNASFGVDAFETIDLPFSDTENLAINNSNGDRINDEGLRMFSRGYLKQGDILEIKIYSQAVVESGLAKRVADFDYGIEVVELSGGYELNPVDVLPNIKQIDLIRDLLKRYGWRLTKGDNDGTIFRLKEFDRILSYKNNTEDWTDKYISHTEDFSSPYFQENQMTYSYDDDADRNIDFSVLINNKNTKFQGSFVSSEVTIPKRSFRTLAGVQGGNVNNFFDRLLILPLYEVEFVDNGGFNTWSYKVNSGDVLRIAKINFMGNDGFTGNDEIDLYVYRKQFATNQTGLPFLSLKNMDMEYYYNRNYSGFENLMNFYKKITANLNLSNIDVKKVDFDKLKFFRQLGRRFMLNSITYTSGKIAKVELVQVLEN